MPQKCHFAVMKKDQSDRVADPRPRGKVTLVLVPGAGDKEVIDRDLLRRDAKAGAPADPWIDELEWIMGFPGTWGERRGGWFTGF
jgi:hypothetical protein